MGQDFRPLGGRYGRADHRADVATPRQPRSSVPVVPQMRSAARCGGHVSDARLAICGRSAGLRAHPAYP
eukprot:8206682-Pyramimonas_sp.AAC.1